MPFVVTKTPANFQALNDELRDFLNILFVYIVDILIFFFQEPWETRSYVPGALWEVWAWNRDFDMQTASFWGLIIQLGRLGSDQEKLQVVEEQSGGLKHRFTSGHILIL